MKKTMMITQIKGIKNTRKGPSCWLTSLRSNDSALLKDRFLKQQIENHPDGYVAISTIASFNKIKQMTDDIKLVKKAMKLSQQLELNEDGTMVRRMAPLPQPRNVDAETVYVEKLPFHADHDWLKKVFSEFGKVLYVSLPRFKHNGEIKGFAFIEFESKQQAEHVVQMFNRESKTKKEEKREPSIDDKTKIKKRRRSHSESDLESSKLSLSQSERKRRRTTSETSVDSNENASPFKPPPCKRSARNESGTADKSVGGTPEAEKTAEGSKTRKRKKSVRWEGSEEETGLNAESETRDSEGECSIKKKKSSESDTNDKKEEDTCESQKKHKTRKRKKKNKEKKVASRLPHLRVISKLEWQRLKEEYKSLQRQAMQDLKKQLKQTSEAQQQTETNSAPKAKPAKPSVPSPTQTAPNKIPPDLPLIQGVVLRFNRLDNELSTKDVRKTFSSYGPVAFVEMDEATGVGYVRFHTPEKCTSILEQLSSEASPSVKVTSLTGEEEKQYWKKINADRVARFQAKREKKRGTEKVISRVKQMKCRHVSNPNRFTSGLTKLDKRQVNTAVRPVFKLVLNLVRRWIGMLPKTQIYCPSCERVLYERFETYSV
ncbi:la-related protein 7 isoform X2 [Nematostella vectensis]|uniref:la-related protein 7 isoform X2 n=1 Tax=Nematostella vectensis TaxID=45351 RepID=UPI00207766AE|nr:la-related protein 7 isoform X2 [Nematostella vectensis]